MDMHTLLDHCFEHFYGLDHSNAAVHCAPVRYSPITFRLAEALTGDAVNEPWSAHTEEVMSARGAYPEDPGR